MSDVQMDLVTRAAFEWLAEYTTIDVDPKNPDIESLPARAQLFVEKYGEVLTMKSGVTSESLGGMSQSFGSTDSSTLLWQIATSLLRGDLKSQVKFYPAKRRW